MGGSGDVELEQCEKDSGVLSRKERNRMIRAGLDVTEDSTSYTTILKVNTRESDSEETDSDSESEMIHLAGLTMRGCHEDPILLEMGTAESKAGLVPKKVSKKVSKKMNLNDWNYIAK